MSLEVLRACSRCTEVKPLSAMTKGRNRCLVCEAARTTKWREKNRQKHRENNAAWKRRNRPGARKAYLLRMHRLRTAPGGAYDTRREDYQARKALYDGKCAYCVRRAAITFDHAIPLSREGTNWPSNIYPSCGQCNMEKGRKKLHLEWTPPRNR